MICKRDKTYDGGASARPESLRSIQLIHNQISCGLAVVLWLIEAAASALRYDLAHILVECPGLRDGFHSLLHLGIRFELNLKPFLHAEVRDQHFLPDLPFDPIQVLGHIRLGIANVMLAQVFAEGLHHAVVHVKFLRDRWFAAHEEAREAAYAALQGIKNVS